MTWHPIKTHPPTASDYPIAVLSVDCRGSKGIFWIPGGTLEEYTHWISIQHAGLGIIAPIFEKLPPPPEKELSFQEREDKIVNAIVMRVIEDQCVPPAEERFEICRRARKSLREEIRWCFSDDRALSLKEMISFMESENNKVFAQALRQLSRLLEGEEGK
jgi:hypothetical protein